jgi:hypothetical protein
VFDHTHRRNMGDLRTRFAALWLESAHTLRGESRLQRTPAVGIRIILTGSRRSCVETAVWPDAGRELQPIIPKSQSSPDLHGRPVPMVAGHMLFIFPGETLGRVPSEALAITGAP